MQHNDTQHNIKNGGALLNINVLNVKIIQLCKISCWPGDMQHNETPQNSKKWWPLCNINDVLSSVTM